MLSNVDLVDNVLNHATRETSAALDTAVYKMWQESGLGLEEFQRTHILEFKQPDVTESHGVKFQLDFNASTFQVIQEFRVRKKTQEELDLEDSRVLPGL